MEAQKSFQLQWDKFAAAVAYLTECSERDETFGCAKLVELLYYADGAAYLQLGTPITGSNYIHADHGPLPEDWRSLADRLESEGVVREGIVRVEGEETSSRHQCPRPALGEKATTAALDCQERSILDDQLSRFAEFSAGQIEEYSHDEVAWRTTEPQRVMPWELAGIRMPKLTDDVKVRGQRIAEHIQKNGRQISRILVERQDAI